MAMEWYLVDTSLRTDLGLAALKYKQQRDGGDHRHQVVGGEVLLVPGKGVQEVPR